MVDELKLYETDDATPLPVITFSPDPTIAGVASAAVPSHLWNALGTPAGTFLRALKFRLVAEITTGVWSETGIPLLDRRELSFRIAGSANPGADPLFVGRTAGAFQPVGAGVLFGVGDMRPNCAVYLETKYTPSIQGGSGIIPWNWRIEPVYNVWSTAYVSTATGILTGCGESSISEWVIAPTVLATGTPDAVVNGGLRWFVGRGISRRGNVWTATLNQNDSAAAALVMGESYEALLSQPIIGGAVVTTKGVKAVDGSTVLPAMPTAHIPIAHVHVAYGAGGSVIHDSDITVLCGDGRGNLGYSGASLTVTLGAVRAQTGRTAIDRPGDTLLLTASVTQTIYLDLAGAWSTTWTDGALSFWSVTTDGSGVTGVVDLRTYIGGRRIVLRKAGNEVQTDDQDWAVVSEPSSIDRIEPSLRVAAAGASGVTVLDVEIEGATCFTTSGLRPSIAAGARLPSVGTAWPEVTTLAGGAAVTLDTATITTGGTRGIDAEVGLWIYPQP